LLIEMGGSTFVKRITRKYSQGGGRNNSAHMTRLKVKVQLDDYTAPCIRVFGSVQSSRSQSLLLFAHPELKSRSAYTKPLLRRFFTFHDGADSRKRFGKIREQHMGNVLSCAKRRKVILAV
jgi:hypothetical protein